MTRNYLDGWTIHRGPAHPVTGQWRARRHGVGMSAGTYEALVSMIRLRRLSNAVEAALSDWDTCTALYGPRHLTTIEYRAAYDRAAQAHADYVVDLAFSSIQTGAKS